MPDDDRVDWLLLEAGERWRATQPAAPPWQAVWRAPARTLDLRWGWVLGAALIATFAGSLAIGGGRPGPSPLPPLSPVVVAWDDEQVRAAEVRPGDTVTATGIVRAKAGEMPLLCAGAFDILMFGIPPSCSPPDVPLSGSVDLSLLPGRQVVADVTFSSEVRVVGRWTGSAIEDPVITSAPSTGYQDPLPCLTPATGWVNPSASGGFRAALDPLAREITAHPELYAGYYTQSVTPGNSFPAVEIVRTKVDPRTLVSRIESLFPYAVCLTHDYSQVELDAAIAAFPAPPATIPAVSGDTHRVGVAIVAVDQDVLPIFMAHPAAYPIPLVTKYVAEPPPGPSPTVPESCPATLRSEEPGPLASQTAGMTLPGSLVPYGQPALWATIPRSGSLSSSTSTTGGRSIRTFWYSDRWSMRDEPSPSISVSAGRLGGGDSVTGSGAVGAHSRELGDSMIVALDLPSGGCWQITGAYRDRSLSYVVWVEHDPSAVIVSDATTLPGDIDGVPVTPIANVPSVLAATQPGQSILVGGFLRPEGVTSCPMMENVPDLWNVCFAIRLSEGPWGGEVVAVYRGASTIALATIPNGKVEPVVLRVHSRDPGCPFGEECSSVAVLGEPVWEGRIATPPLPTNTQPPLGLSREDAIRDAIGISFNNGGSLQPDVIGAIAGPYAAVQPEGTIIAGDRWVWLVTLQVVAPPPSCPSGAACPGVPSKREVVLDFLDGNLVIMSTSIGPAATLR